MKTATITWISYKNYGTYLQAYALQRAIQSLNAENVIVSDQIFLPSQSDGWKKKNNHSSISFNGNLLHRIRQMHGYLSESKIDRMLERSSQKFDEFKADYLKIQDLKVFSEISFLEDNIDLYICGSDQIWSVLDHNFNEYYFLNFTNKKKMAYAPSIGQYEIPEKYKDRICRLTKDYYALSLRESYSAKQIACLLERNDVQWVCDPTLLLKRSEWESICKDGPADREKYLLCYFLEDKEWYFNYAEHLAEYLGLEIKLIPNRRGFMYRNTVIKGGVGPKEFVGLIKDASFVLTDSYHGSIFSLIFNKKFLYLKRFSDGPGSQNIRIDSLFGYLGICDLILGEKAFENNDIESLDYQRINSRLKKHIDDSIAFLERSLLNADN